MLKTALGFIIATFALVSAVVAQPGIGGPGPGPPVSPWLYAPPSIYAPAGSCITFPQTVPGGCPGGGNAINVAGGYYLNGVNLFARANVFTALQTVDLGTGSAPPIDTGVGFAVFAANGTTGRFEAVSFGAASTFTGTMSLGTRAAPTVPVSSTLMAQFNAHGYDTSIWTGAGSGLRLYAEGTWSPTSHPGAICLAAVLAGTVAPNTDWLCVHNDGGVSVSASGVGATSMGAGTINASAYYVNGSPAIRARLTSAITVYVNGSSSLSGNCNGSICQAGSDSTANPLSIATPFLHGQNAVNYIAGNIDLNLFQPVVQFTDAAQGSAAAANYTVNCGFGPFVGGIGITVQGNSSTPANVHVTAPNTPTNAGYAVNANDYCVLFLRNFQIDDAGSAAGAIRASEHSIIDVQPLIFGAFNNNAGEATVLAQKNAIINFNAAGSIIAGGGGTFLLSQYDSVIQLNPGITLSIPSAVAFTTFASAIQGGRLKDWVAGTFTGSGVAGTTGQRASLSTGASASLGGSTINSVFPGNANAVILPGASDDFGDPLTTPWAVASGGTNCTSASVTCFNNITGYSAAGATGTTSTNLVFSGSPTIASLTVTGALTATGLVTNADLVSPSITVNGATCTLGSSCSPGAGAIAVGDSLTGGTPNGLIYNSANSIGNLATANNGVLVTSSGGVPSISSTLPSGIAATNMALTTPILGVAGGTSLALGGATIGGNALAVTGSVLFNTALGVPSGGSGNATAAAHSIPVSEGASAQNAVGPCSSFQAIIYTSGSGSDPSCASTRQSVAFAASTPLAANTTYYCWNQGCSATVLTVDSAPFSIAGTFSNLVYDVVTAPGVGQTITATLYVGTFGSEVATSITCQIAGTNTSCTDTTHTAAISVGQAVSLQVALSTTASGTTGSGFGLQFSNP